MLKQTTYYNVACDCCGKSPNPPLETIDPLLADLKKTGWWVSAGEGRVVCKNCLTIFNTVVRVFGNSPPDPQAERNGE